MDIAQARTFVAALKPDAQFIVGGETFVVTSRDCGSTEFCRPAHRDITGSYFRWSDENLAIALSGEPGVAP